MSRPSDSADEAHERPFEYHAQGRSLRAALVVALIWAVLIFAWAVLEASLLLLGLAALATLPALWELASNPQSMLSLDHAALSWRSGRRSARFRLAEIDHVALNTRLDLSVKATIFLRSGTRHLIPPACTPAAMRMEKACAAVGISVRRTHFQLLQ